MHRIVSCPEPPVKPEPGLAFPGPREPHDMIEAFKSEEIVEKFGGRFRLTAVIQRRLVQLMEGARPLVEREGRTDLEVVIQEILEDKIEIVDAPSGGRVLAAAMDEEPLL